MKSYQVRVWEIRYRSDRKSAPHRVRWIVGGEEFEEGFRTKALATSFKAELVKAMNDGQPFDTETGRPVVESRAANTTTWLTHAQAYIDKKWPRLAANSRRSTVEALTDVTLLAMRSVKRGRPDGRALRRILRDHLLNVRRRGEPISDEDVAVIAWLGSASLSVVDLANAGRVRSVLDGLCINQNGSPAAATVVRRKRAVFYNALGYAVEEGLLDSNPLDKVQWTAPEVAQAVDRRVVANPAQVAAMLAALQARGQRAHRVVAFFGCIYYAGARPAEAADLRATDCVVPATCHGCGQEIANVLHAPSRDCDHEQLTYQWGRVTFVETDPRAGSNWTNDGRPNERRGLKHRARKETRPVPAPPELGQLLHRHVQEFRLAPDGRLFYGLHGGTLPSSVYDRWWKIARREALTETQAASPLARRAYDLRHGAASLWLNAGLPVTEVARRLGHSVAVLLRVYANCIDGGDEGLNERISGALGR